jgi:hypothetical protein
MHGGFGGGGGGGGGYGHSGGGGGYGHSGGGHSGGGHSGHSGHSGGHSGGGHAQPMAHDGGHPMHAAHHHAGGSKDDKGSSAKGQGQSFLSHATSLVQNGHGILGAIAQALSGHTTTGHGAGTGQSMHLDQYLSPLQAEKKDSSDQVGNPGALSHPDNLVQNGMVSRRTHNEPRIVLAAIFGGLLIWMLVVQVFSGGAPVHKRMAYNSLQQRSLAAQDMGQNSSVAPLLSILSMAESHSPSSGISGGISGIGQALRDDSNSDPNEATQTDSSAASERNDARESSDNDSRYEKEQADLRNESSADSEKNSDSSGQLAAAMQIFQPRATANAGTATQSAMVAPASPNPVSMRSISQGAPVSARLTARPMGNPHPVQMASRVPVAAPSNLLQAETLQKSAQETFAAGTFGGPRALSSEEPILIGTQPTAPGASSVLRVQKPGSPDAPVSASQPPQPLLSAANTQTNPDPTSFASLFIPAGNGGPVPLATPFKNDSASNTRRRWRTSQAATHRTINSARNSTIADASIYTNSPVDELGHSRKRVLTDR